MTLCKSLTADCVKVRDINARRGSIGNLTSYSIDTDSMTATGAATSGSLVTGPIIADSLDITGALVTGSVTTGAITATTLTTSGNVTIGGNIVVTGTITGTIPVTTITGCAMYEDVLNGPNTAPPGDAFTASTPVVNQLTGYVTPFAELGGTVWLVSTGTYIIGYECSLTNASSFALWKCPYTGPGNIATDLTHMAIDPHTIAGSTTATTWINGGTIEVVPTATSEYVMISAGGSGTPVVAPAGDSSSYMFRVTFNKTS